VDGVRLAQKEVSWLQLQQDNEPYFLLGTYNISTGGEGISSRNEVLPTY
jgi:hypothetical protein